MDKRKINKQEALIKDFSETYLSFIDFAENPARRGAIGLLCKIRPEAKAPVKDKLMDILCATESSIRVCMSHMKEAMSWNKDVPDGF